MSSLSILPINASETLALRHSVLRPGRPLATARFPGDDAPSTRHFGAFRDGRLLGIASLFVAEMPAVPALAALQLRGMAITSEARGSGLGRALTLACISYAKEQGAQILWCNARSCAVGFYRKLGFQSLGAEFNVPDIGPHLRMILRLEKQA